MRYFDLHCDTITECCLKKRSLYDNDLHVSLKKAMTFEPWVQVFAVWIPDTYRNEAAKHRFDNVYDTFTNEMKKNADLIKFCANSKELGTALSEGKNAALLSIEGSAALCGEIENLYDVYNKGVRIITLTWNGHCEAGDGSGVSDAKGLTSFGFLLIKEMQKLHMVIDVSHLSDAGFIDVVNTISGPIIASHSNSRVICPNRRNLRDEMFKEIVGRKGLVGINLYPDFIKMNEKVDYEYIIKHIDHFLSLGGEDILSIGADFDGASMPEGITGIGDMSKIYELLLKNYNERLANKIFFDNAYKFLNLTLTDCESCNNIYHV